MVKSNTVSLVVNAGTIVTITMTIVSSATNARIAGATLVWTSVSTGETYSGTTNSNGVSAVQMPAGQYYLKVSASGYQTFDSTPSTEECLSSWSAGLALTPVV